MTAIFTPGYAAAEQFTSAKQGPWTDIYGLSATLYHAITGQTPPSAFDRMLDDAYEPLGKKALPGFPRGLLAGIDAGLAVRASDRPQSIAGWRPILGQFAALAGDATVVLVPPSAAPPPAPIAPVAEKAAAPAKRRGIGLWIGAAAGDRGAGRRLLRAGRRQARDAAGGGGACPLGGRQGRTGRPAGGRGAAPEGPGRARQAARRGRRAREGRAGGRAAPDRRGDAAQDRGRNGGEETPGGRGPAEGGGRGGGQAQGRGEEKARSRPRWPRMRCVCRCSTDSTSRSR